MAYRLNKIAAHVWGWMGYYRISEFYRPIPELDGWIRRRVRMFYWSRSQAKTAGGNPWRQPRTRIRNLLRLGTRKKDAILTGISRRGYWHLARTLATQTGMTNQWLSNQGLISVRDRWISFHYPSYSLGRDMVNRLVRTRMLGGVGRAGENPAFTRFHFVGQWIIIWILE